MDNNLKTVETSNDKLPPALSFKAVVGYFFLALVSFQLAFEFSALSFLMLVFVFSLLKLSEVKSCRYAFCLGSVIGLVNYAIQLFFLWTIFGVFAISLWFLLGVFIGAFVALTRFCRLFAGRKSLFFIPFLWMGIEYFRSELYPFKFSWLSLSGVFAQNPSAVFIQYFGYYGLGFTLVALACVVYSLRTKKSLIVGVLILGTLAFLSNRANECGAADGAGPFVVGIQYESAATSDILAKLNLAIERNPQTDLLVLSECAFGGEIPKSVKNWCKKNKKHLIAGGSDSLPNAKEYYNTSFVIGPEGEVVFKQAKSVPVQFFDDGLPAKERKVWNSPWGKIGICICYDLSFSRVTDELVRQGAMMLVVPTYDARSWGAREHFLHARIAPLKAAEYRVPIVRVCSSGISEMVDSNGNVLAQGSFPGQGELVAQQMIMSPNSRLPIDRYFALASALIASLLCLVALSWGFYKRVIAPGK